MSAPPRARDRRTGFALVAAAAAALVAASILGAVPPDPHEATTEGRTVPSSVRPAITPMAVPASHVAVAGGFGGLGPLTAAGLPAGTGQVLVVTADGVDDDAGALTRWERDHAGTWHQLGGTAAVRNGAAGWTRDPREGDLRSPVGTYHLTAAGGARPDPGGGLPYDHDEAFYAADGPSVDETTSIAGSLDHVVAIDFNRVPHTPPRDPRRPWGAELGGDIWLHADHGSATRGCIAVDVGVLAGIIRWLDPEEEPVIVMGDAATLAS